jgi:hypothetical protein
MPGCGRVLLARGVAAADGALPGLAQVTPGATPTPAFLRSAKAGWRSQQFGEAVDPVPEAINASRFPTCFRRSCTVETGFTVEPETGPDLDGDPPDPQDPPPEPTWED